MKFTLFLLVATLAAAQTVPTGTVVGSGYTFPAPVNVAPGQIITLLASGVGSSLTGPVQAPPSNLPTTLAGITVTFVQGNHIAAPILQVRPVSTCGQTGEAGCGSVTAITIQVPFEIVANCVGPVCPLQAAVLLTQLFVSENGVQGALIDVTPVPQQIHILTACDTVFPGASGYRSYTGLPCQPYVTHADGLLVTATNPAQVGEELVAYAVGLGTTSPAVPTGQPASAPAPVTQPIALDFNYRLNALATEPQMPGMAPLFAGLTSGFPGLYQINFTVAAPAVPGQFVPGCLDTPGPGAVLSNLTVSVGGLASFDGAGICVAVPAA